MSQKLPPKKILPKLKAQAGPSEQSERSEKDSAVSKDKNGLATPKKTLPKRAATIAEVCNQAFPPQEGTRQASAPKLKQGKKRNKPTQALIEELSTLSPVEKPTANEPKSLEEAYEDWKLVKDVPALMAFLKARRLSGPFVPWPIRAVVKTGDQALVLAQLLYWFDVSQHGIAVPRARLFLNGRRTVAKSHEELGKEVGLTARKVKSVIASLKKQGLIDVEYHLFAGPRVSHFFVNMQQLWTRLAKVLSETSWAAEDDSRPYRWTDSVPSEGP